ncbi:DUF6172 family protein [Oceanospirillum linum]|uniref:DUF6172 family protein n=1 Tax=Oceanospirillum linum TaxID=966 RepID=UPI00089EAF7B|nr:DUF6172 family protein [Oceanospirillum linum]SEF94284.1 hypothetical protein SAMN04489856_103216 [Oleiphilus messinensis]SMP11914.1 hypothetical protein SAMN06264348_102324 [Oceanospirillum linum]
MKKTFKLSHSKIKYPRLIEAAKNEAKKYLKRERNKVLPKGFDFWDFDCKFGADTESAQEIHVTQINEKISHAEAEQWQSFYLEIIAVPANRVFVEREEEPEQINDGTEDAVGTVRQREATDPFEDDQPSEDS